MDLYRYDEETFVIHYQLDEQYVGRINVNWNYVAKIYVLPGYRRRGLGTALLAAAEAEIARGGYAEVKLDCIPDDVEKSRLDAFYRKNGYSTEDGIRFYKKL